MFGRSDFISSSWQDDMMVCEKGHQITDAVKDTHRPLPERCQKCGAKTITTCPECGTSIPGRMHIEGVLDLGSEPVPEHCGKCGKPFPWTEGKSNTPVEESPVTQSNKVFIVHGHDDGMKEAVARTLTTLGLEPIILHEQPNEGRTIIEKFEKNSDVGFAVVLMSPDDMAFKKDDDVKKVKPKYRARQNVIFELGFFIGQLGRHRVLVLQKEDVENLSDYSGVIYEKYDNSSGLWRFRLAQELQAQNYERVSADMLTRGSTSQKNDLTSQLTHRPQITAGIGTLSVNTHERLTEVLSELFEKLERSYDAVFKFSAVLEWSNAPPKTEQLKEAIEKVNLLSGFVQRNSLYISDVLNRTLQDYLVRATRIIRWLRPEYESEHRENVRNTINLDEVDDDVAKLGSQYTMIRFQLQQRLGLQ